MAAIEYREQLYAVLSDSGAPIEERIDRALDVGVEYLGLPVGFLTRIDDGTQEIVHATGDHDLIQPGATCPLDDAYCRRTIEIESPLAIRDADVSSAVSESAIETFGLGTYIGARIVVRNEVYGTICFADTEARGEPFSEGESFFVELAARLVGQLLERQSYERDVAERETEINRREAVYRAVVDASFDLVFQIDSEGRFTYLSSTVEDLLGHPPEEYLGRHFTAMLPDEETERVAEEVYEAVMSGETVEREYFPLQHRTDGTVLVDIRVTPLFSGDVLPGSRASVDIVGVQGMAHDARSRQRRQRLIRVLNRVLRHNLRNDMNVIGGYADVLCDHLDGEMAAHANTIAETTDRLVRLSETVRQIEENFDTPADIDAVDIVPVVVRTATALDEQYPEASVTTEVPESAMARSAPRLETAVSELMENAAEHAGERPSIAVSVTEEGDSVVIQVADDGPGLPANERAVLLSGEETPLEHGSGLGLWLVYWVVESLGGQLAVRDGDEGACIEIALRRTEEVAISGSTGDRSRR